MSRIIKFRVWSPKHNEMLLAQELHWFHSAGKNCEGVSAIVCSKTCNKNAVTYGIPCGDGIPMQYTGFKDKNGKEIYELHELNNKFRVIWRFNRYVLQDISNGDIIEMYEQQSQREITREYSPMEKG